MKFFLYNQTAIQLLGFEDLLKIIVDQCLHGLILGELREGWSKRANGKFKSSAQVAPAGVTDVDWQSWPAHARDYTLAWVNYILAWAR